MVKSWSPPEESIDNINLVWDYAKCDIEERKHERKKILANFEEIDLSYRLMAENIREIK